MSCPSTCLLPVEGARQPDPVKVAADLLALAEQAADPRPLITAARAILEGMRADARGDTYSRSVAEG